VEDDHHDGSHTAKPVENLITGLGRKIGVVCHKTNECLGVKKEIGAKLLRYILYLFAYNPKYLSYFLKMSDIEEKSCIFVEK